MSSQQTDEWLMANVAKGQRGSLEILIRRYASPLLTFIQRMVGNLHRSEELFQEVFLAVWNKRASYDFPRPFRPWLYTIALNQCRADFRKKSRSHVIHADSDATASAITSDPEPLSTMIATETAETVTKALNYLSPQQRTVVVLRIWQEMSYAEIADLLDRSEGTIRSHMHHALASLREHLTVQLEQ